MGQFPELMGLLTRVNALGILASAEFAQPALRLKAVLESRGCAVAAAVEAFPAEQPQTSHVQAVLVLGDAPGDPDAFKQDGELGLASSLAFAAIAAGAPVKAMNGKSGKEDVSSLIQDLKELPILDPHEARQRWAQAEAAAAADDEEGLEGALESWPELMTHRDSSGSTLLHHAASMGADRATSLLLERGADADLRNKEQATAGDIAFRAGKQFPGLDHGRAPHSPPVFLLVNALTFYFIGDVAVMQRFLLLAPCQGRSLSPWSCIV